jgi:hypothetical protein
MLYHLIFFAILYAAHTVFSLEIVYNRLIQDLNENGQKLLAGTWQTFSFENQPPCSRRHLHIVPLFISS